MLYVWDNKKIHGHFVRHLDLCTSVNNSSGRNQQSPFSIRLLPNLKPDLPIEGLEIGLAEYLYEPSINRCLCVCVII